MQGRGQLSERRGPGDKVNDVEAFFTFEAGEQLNEEDALVAVYHSDHRELCAHERDWPFASSICSRSWARAWASPATTVTRN